MRRLAIGLAGFAWCTLVFLVAARLTFPSQAAVDRIRWEVQRATDGEIALDIERLTPTLGLGASADNVRVHRVQGDEATELFTARSAWARVGILSLLRGRIAARGGVGYGDGDLTFSALVEQAERGYALSDLDVQASSFPIASLPPMGGVGIEGTGALDLEVDLQAHDGLRKSNGQASLFGEGLQITKIVGDPMLEGFDLAPTISVLDLKLDITEGRAKVTRGRVVSDLFQLDLSGELVLMERIERSRLRMQASITLEEELSMLAGFLKPAERSDGSFRYRVLGTLQRPNFRPDGERARRPSPPSRPRNTARPRTTEPDQDVQDRIEERRQRREELRKAREERIQAAPRDMDRAIGRPGVIPSRLRDIDLMDDEELLEDEELMDDELLDDELMDEELLEDEALLYEE